MDDNDKAYVVALVYAYVRNSPEYASWVPSYSTLRASRVVTVGGHFRQKALYRHLLKALPLVCKFEDLSLRGTLVPPPRAARRRWDENGAIIPMEFRTLEFF